MDLRFTWAPQRSELEAAACAAVADPESGVCVREVEGSNFQTEQGTVRRARHRLTDREGRDLDESEVRRRIDPYLERPFLWRPTEEWRRLPRVDARAVLAGCRRVEALRGSLRLL